MKFKLIKENSDNFESIVNMFLKDGWVLYGNTFLNPNSNYLYQAMYKP